MIYSYMKKIVNQDPGSGPAGLQVNSGQVKKLNFLFVEIMEKFFNKKSVSLDDIFIYGKKNSKSGYRFRSCRPSG